MAAGTITIYNNTTAVTGYGTAFATTLAPGDFIVFNAGGVVYTCAVESVINDASVTLAKAYTGPTIGGAAWDLVKRGTASLITMELAAQVTEAMRGLLLDKNNWQKVLSNSGNVTVTLSDGSTFSGPSWAYLVGLLNTANTNIKNLGNNKLDKYGFDQLTVSANANTVTVRSHDAGQPSYILFQTSAGSNIGYVGKPNSDDSIIEIGKYSGGTITFNADGSLSMRGIAHNIFGRIYLDGAFQASGRGSFGAPAATNWTNSYGQNNAGCYVDTSLDQSGGSAIAGYTYSYQHSGGYHLTTSLSTVGNGTNAWGSTVLHQAGDRSKAGERYWYFNPQTGDLITTAGGGWAQYGNWTFQKSATSDRDLKHDIEYGDGKQAYENLKRFKPCTFVYNFDKQNRIRRGVIAQDLLGIDREYIKLVQAAPAYNEDGERVDADDTLALDNNVIMMDTALAVSHLIGLVEKLEDRIADLERWVKED